MEGKTRQEDDFIFKEIADYTYDWESWIDPEGATRWVNPAVKRITGYTAHECLAHPDYPLFLVHEEDRMRVSDALEHARRHVSGNDLEFRIAHKNGSIRWGAISWQDLLDRSGRHRGFRTSVRDITERKNAEAEVLSSRDEAYRASRAKSEFLATMSHEIRTPIQNILGCTQILSQTALSHNQGPLLGVMRDQGELLLRIVDDVLDFTALQSAQLRIEKRPFRLLAEIQLVVDAARGAAEAKNLSLTWHNGLHEDLPVLGDSHRLRQVLGNLVTNAIKFTDQGEVKITVTNEAGSGVSLGTTDGHHSIRLEVQDSGIGISEDDQAELFQPFHQIDPSASRRHGGSGLGLSICKRLVELMEGTLQVRSAPGVGSTFAVMIPFEAAPKTSPLPRAPLCPSPATPLSILVVEDTQVAREVIVALLESLGQRPDAVGTAAQALELMKGKTYQLLLMDKHMSGTDGLTLTRLIRADQSLVQPYIVAVTANVLAEARDACMAAGMDAFVGKPVRLVDLELLMTKVQTRVNLRKRLGVGAACFDLDVLDELQAVRSAGQSLLQKQAPTILAELNKALNYLAHLSSQADAEEVRQWAHGLRGSLRTVGAKEAAQHALALENCTEGGVSPTRAAAANALQESLARARDGIANLASQI